MEIHTKHYQLLIWGILFFSVFLRLYSAYTQPLWLDEQYSIYFAKLFPLSSLLLHFTADTQPGLYYAFLRILLKLTENLFILRTISSVIPQVIGLLIIIRNFTRYKLPQHTRDVTALLAIIFLGLNPFYIHLAWQLRMYSLGFLFVCISYYLTQSYLQKKSKIHLLLLGISLLIGNLTFYIMELFTFCIVMYLVRRSAMSFIKKSLLLSCVVILLLLQLIIAGSSHFSTQFAYISWVQKPNLINIPTVIATTLGLYGDIHSTAINFSYIHILFYTLGILAIGWVIRKRGFTRQIKSSWTFFVILPLLSILLISLILPEVAKIAYIGKYIPGVSLFLPRVLLPFSILFMILASESLAKYIHNKNFQIFVFVGILLFYVWIVNNFNLNINDFNHAANNSITFRLLDPKNSMIMWPSWTFLYLISPQDTISSTLNIKNKIQYSMEIIKPILIQQTLSNCDVFSSADIILNKSASFSDSLKYEMQKVKLSVSRCCDLIGENENYSKWRCQ